MKTHSSLRRLRTGLLLLTIFALASCRQFDSRTEEVRPDPRPARRAALEGLWQSEGYGYVMDIKDGRATVYDYTSSTCLKKSFFFDSPGFDVAGWDVTLDAKGNELVYKAKGPITEFRFRRIKKLPPVCENGGIRPTTDARVNFDVMWQTFQDHYAFFKLRGVDWKALRTQYRPQVTEANLETIFQQMLSHFNEDHVTLSVNGDDFLSRFDAGAPRTFARFYAEAPAGASQGEVKAYAVGEYQKVVGNVIANYLQGAFQSALGDQVIWGKLNGGKTGYLLVSQMSGYELIDLQATLDQVFTDLAACEGMIVDVRFNLGGSDRLALEIAGRFTPTPRVAYRFAARNGDAYAPEQVVHQRPTGSYAFTKPTVLLTSIVTSSAAEVFTLCMRQLPQVKTMGETTNGIFSTVLPKELPNGWLLTLSNEVAADAAGQVYEKTGIPVSLAAPFPTQADRESGIDPGIEQALEQF